MLLIEAVTLTEGARAGDTSVTAGEVAGRAERRAEPRS